MTLKVKHQPLADIPACISHCVIVRKNLSWKVLVHGHEVDPQTAGLSGIPDRIKDVHTIEQLLSKIDHLNVCSGHPDKHFIEMVEKRKGVLMSTSGNVAAYIDKAAPVELNGQVYNVTLHTVKCTLLTPTSKCPCCVAYCDTARSMYHRWTKPGRDRPLHSTSHVNEKWMKIPENKQKMEDLKKRVRSAEKTIK